MTTAPSRGDACAARRARRSATRDASALPAPLVWTFDGPFERCLADLEDTLRRAIVLVGDVSRVALLIDLSLPALQRRVDAGDALQPAWGRFSSASRGYGLPALPRVRHLRTRRPAGDARRRLSQLNSSRDRHVDEIVGPPSRPGHRTAPPAAATCRRATRRAPAASRRSSADAARAPAARRARRAAARRRRAPRRLRAADRRRSATSSSTSSPATCACTSSIAERDRFLLTSIGVRCARRRRARASCCSSSCTSSSPSRSSATWRAR